MVTATQMQSASPIYAALNAVTTTLAQLNAANGTNSILGFVVDLGDTNENGTGQIIINIPMAPATAAPLFAAMIAQLTTLQTTLQGELAAI